MYYQPKQKLNIDESVIPFRGPISFRTYDCKRKKKETFGIRLFTLCDDNGYILNCKIATDPTSLDKKGFMSN